MLSKRWTSSSFFRLWCFRFFVRIRIRNWQWSTAAEHILISFVHSDALHTVHSPSHIQTFGTWFLLIHYFHLAVAWKRWPMSSFSGLYPILTIKKTISSLKTVIDKKILTFQKMYCIIEMLKSKKYRSRFATSNNNPAKHQSWVSAHERHLIQFKVYYTYNCNNSQECRFMHWCEFDYFFDLNSNVAIVLLQC